MQHLSANHNSMRAAIGRRLGVGGLASADGDEPPWSDDGSSLPASHALAGQPPIREQASPAIWRQTRRHRTTRSIGNKSKRSFRVSVVDVRGQGIRSESLLEAWLVLVLLACPYVVDVIEHPELVKHFDDEDELEEHWSDCVAVLSDGRRIACGVKPKALAVRQGTRQLVELLARQIGPDVADIVVHTDEDCMSQADVHNAELIDSVRLHGPWADDPVVAAMTAVVRGPMPLDEAVLHWIALDCRTGGFDEVTMVEWERGTAKRCLRRIIDEAGIEPVFTSSTRSVTIHRHRPGDVGASVQRARPAVGTPPLPGAEPPTCRPGTPANHPRRVVADGRRSRDDDPVCHGPAGRK